MFPKEALERHRSLNSLTWYICPSTFFSRTLNFQWRICGILITGATRHPEIPWNTRSLSLRIKSVMTRIYRRCRNETWTGPEIHHLGAVRREDQARTLAEKGCEYHIIPWSGWRWDFPLSRLTDCYQSWSTGGPPASILLQSHWSLSSEKSHQRDKDGSLLHTCTYPSSLPSVLLTRDPDGWDIEHRR